MTTENHKAEESASLEERVAAARQELKNAEKALALAKARDLAGEYMNRKYGHNRKGDSK
jgi:hypothetical protein